MEDVKVSVKPKVIKNHFLNLEKQWLLIDSDAKFSYEVLA